MDASDPDADLAWETVAETTAYRCPDFRVREQAVRLPDGTGTEFAHVTEPAAVVVLPRTPDGDVVVVEEWRQAVDRANLGVPAGTLEADESPSEAARRELAEETGYVADSVEVVASVEPANGLTDAVHHHAVATGCTPDGTTDLDADESIRTATRSLAALRAAAAAGDLRDGRTATAVLTHWARDRDAGERNP